MEQDDQTALRIAVESENLLSVSDLLEKGIKPSIEDFVCAIRQRSYPMLQLLLLNGYQINQQLRDDYPPPLE